MPIDNEGAVSNWTLRFKHGRLTILLFSDPLTPFSALKTELLAVLRERYPAGLPHSPKVPGKANITIPKSIRDVALAVPVDVYDASKGWEELTVGGSTGGLKDSPKSLGLKDGATLAFMFRDEDEDEEASFQVEWPNYDELYGDKEAEMGDDEDEDEDDGRDGETLAGTGRAVEDEDEEDDSEEEIIGGKQIPMRSAKR